MRTIAPASLPACRQVQPRQGPAALLQLRPQLVPLSMMVLHHRTPSLSPPPPAALHALSIHYQCRGTQRNRAPLRSAATLVPSSAKLPKFHYWRLTACRYSQPLASTGRGWDTSLPNGGAQSCEIHIHTPLTTASVLQVAAALSTMTAAGVCAAEAIA